ncbi:MAG: GAF domain-containing protein, partial [Cyanobacteriota bacterium]|nr:GAF domain-containing protein [Cyanobacteriota bacterium]
MELSNNTQNMPSKIEQEGLLHRITNRIRQSLELQEILISTVAEIRSFLETDRVKVYQFHADGSGQVIAESIYNNRLPSLLGLNFPADDIPPHAREMFIKARGRSIVDLATGKIGISQLDCPQTGIPLESQGFYYREVDPCHIEYLTAMGVQSSFVVPILQYDVQAHKVQPQLWGLLVSHNAQTRTFSERELQIVQLVADQVSIAIAQSNLLRRAREQAIIEAKINRVATLLHTLPSIEVQQALIETVAAFKGSGGRLYIAAEKPSFGGKQFTCGAQPMLVGLKKDSLLEESLVWQQYFKLQDPACNSPVAIRDIYKEPGLRVLAAAFRPTKIRGMIVIPLEYRQE